MDYYEGLIKNTEFLTTTELAEKLKMNVQVITRKVQAGEIYAYKIGKDWRIPEQAVYTWLETHSNKKPSSSAKTNKQVTKLVSRKQQFVSKPKEPPRAKSTRKHFLEYILAQLEPNKLYGEDEINRIISRFDSNFAEVRNEFISERMVDLVDGQYRRCSEYRLSDN